MPQRVRVFELARELGVSILVVIQVAERLKLPVRRGAAELTPRQEQLIRAEVDRGGWKDRTRRSETEPAPTYWSAPSVRYPTCECCGFRFVHYTPPSEPPPQCEHCTEHYEIEGESTDRVIARLEDHEQRARDRYLAASSKATEYEGRMKAAYESRQKWKAALVEIAVGHEQTDDGKCLCGAKESPCTTLRFLEYANKGIARQVERLAALPREALNHELYRDEPWCDVDLRLDDDPAASTTPGENPAA